MLKNILCVIIWDYVLILAFMRFSTGLCFFRRAYALNYKYMRFYYPIKAMLTKAKRKVPEKSITTHKLNQ